MIQPPLQDATLELSKGVALLTFCRDDVRNALTGTALVEDLLAVLAWIGRTPEVSVLVVTGAGAAFSSGGNVKDMRERRGLFAGSALAIQEQYRQGIQRLPLAMERAEIPLIAAVNGAAVGAGLDLALMCDLRLGSSEAVVGETFINLGIVPGDGGAWYLPRAVGHQRAAELAFTGRMVAADEAQRLGLFLEVLPPEELLPRARALAAQIAAKPPHAVRMTKRLLKAGSRGTLPDFLDLCACLQGMAHQTDDHQEAVAAFLGKRQPNFNGR